jgi:hypothetical protein
LFLTIVLLQASFADHPYLCEVGDLSGKFGVMMPDESGKIFELMATDVLPPITKDYSLNGGDDPVSFGPTWASFVVHCNAPSEVKGTKLVCAKIQLV